MGIGIKLFSLLLFSLFIVNSSYSRADVDDNKQLSYEQKQVEFQVNGQVTDATTGEPLPGVNVIVKGTSIGTATNSQGNYQLTVSSSTDTLVFSFIGYQTKTIPINNRSTINVTLSSKAILGKELVVVGYGRQQQRNVVGSISQVSAEDLNEVPALTNLSQALRGQVSGVRIQRTSTRPGSSARIRIRGTRSLTASNRPLIVVNNVPYGGSLNDLNINNIKSIQVLKDATATAIYGSRGANGVIVVTTKDGRLNQPAQITYSGYSGVNTVARRYQVFSGPEFVALRDFTGYPYTPRELGNKKQEDYTNWQDLMYSPGRIANHQLTVSGGTETTTYSFGGGYFYESTVLPGISFKRYSLNANVTQKIGDRIEIGFFNTTSYQLRKGQSAGMMYSILTLTPVSPAFDSTGSYVTQPAYPNENYYNPLFIKKDQRWEERSKRIATFNTIYGTLDIYKGLSYRLNIGLSYRQQQYGNYYGSRTPFNNGSTSTAEVNNGRSVAYTIQNILHYKTDIAQKHSLNITALYSIHQAQEDNTLIQNKNINANYLLYYNLGLSTESPIVPANSQGYMKRGLISYMLRANYSYDHRYVLTVTGRRDGSSVLAEGNKWNNYFAIGVGWNIANEAFMQGQDVVNKLKLRLTYGQTGSQAIAPYQTFGGLSQNKYNFGSNNVYGYYVSNLPNRSLGWEHTESYNIGIDFGFLDNRITGSINLYKQHTYDLILAQSLPQTSGVPGSYLTNVGETQNKGIGIGVSALIFTGRDGFRWSADLNFSMNKNKILALNSGIKRNIGNGWFVGHPINVVYDFKKVGIWQLTEALKAAKYGKEPGDIHIKDLNNDGDITGDDRKILGTLNPDFTFGFSTQFGYKGFDLSIVTFGRIGGMLISTIHQPQSYLNMLSGRRNQIKVDYWTPTNPTNAYPKPEATGNIPEKATTLGYFDASYFKIRSITLGYTLPPQWVESFGAQSLRIYANVRNVGIFFSPYMEEGGISPLSSGQGGQGVTDGGIPDRQLTIGANPPPARTFAVGIKFTF